MAGLKWHLNPPFPHLLKKRNEKISAKIAPMHGQLLRPRMSKLSPSYTISLNILYTK